MGQSLQGTVRGIRRGDTSTVKDYIELNFEKIDFYYEGGTLLHYAAYYNRHEIAKLLVSSGANRSLKTQNGFFHEIAFPFHLHGKTALEIGTLENYSNIVDILQEHASKYTQKFSPISDLSDNFTFQTEEFNDTGDTSITVESSITAPILTRSSSAPPAVTRGVHIGVFIPNADPSHVPIVVEELPVASSQASGTSQQHGYDASIFNTNNEMEFVELFSQLDINIEHVPKFLNQELKVQDLQNLSADELETLVPQLGPRKKLLKYIEDLSKPQQISSGFYYPVSCLKRGIALVIGNGNTETIQKCCHQNSKKMRCVLETLGYEVQYFEDLSANEIWIKVREIKMIDHSVYDSFIMYFSGFGTAQAIFGGDQPEIKESDMLEICDLIDNFQTRRCASLTGKPKVFLWDCCSEQEKVSLSDSSLNAPQYDDFLYGYATCERFISCPETQSPISNMSIWTYFLQSKLLENRNNSLVEILTMAQYDAKQFVKKHKRKLDINYLSYLTKFVKVSN